MNIWRWMRLIIRTLFRILVWMGRHTRIWFPLGLSLLIGLVLGRFMVSTSHAPGWVVPIAIVLAAGILTPKIRKVLDEVFPSPEGRGGDRQ